MRSFNSGTFGQSDDPWFRVGTFDVGTSALVSIVAFVGMLVYSFEGPANTLSKLLWFDPDKIVSGQIWRIVTYWIPNAPGFFPLIGILLIFAFGTRLEGPLGRRRMVTFVSLLGLIPAIALLLLDIIGYNQNPFFGVSIIGSGLFYAFIAFMPGAQSFFGIPLWWLGAAFFGINMLASIASRDLVAFVLEIVVVGGALILARSFGLAPTLDWIPDARSLGGSNPGARPTTHKPSRARRKTKLRPVPPQSSVADVSSDAEMDALLDQVATLGLDSLSKAQRKKLEAYSKRLRDRDQ